MIGYEYLLSHLGMRMPPLDRPAQVRPVTRVEHMPDLLAVPRHVAPAADAPAGNPPGAQDALGIEGRYAIGN